jgi:hypothetical protein
MSDERTTRGGHITAAAGAGKTLTVILGLVGMLGLELNRQERVIILVIMCVLMAALEIVNAWGKVKLGNAAQDKEPEARP